MKMTPIEVRPKGNRPWHPRYTADVVLDPPRWVDGGLVVDMRMVSPMIRRGRVGFRRWWRLRRGKP